MLKALYNTDKSASEMINILRKPYLSTKDMAELLGCAHCTAWRVYDEITKLQIKKGGQAIPRYVTKEAFLEWQGMTLDDYIRQAKIEKEIQGGTL